MYVGEVPLSYISPTDRYLAFADLLFDELNPTATPSHEALIRLEDISPESSPSDLTAYAAYLKSQGVPFSMATIPQYTDPTGFYNNGVPVSATLAQKPAMVSALKTAISDGGTLVQHGYTHQYSNVDNPFSGVTGDDFEFYRAQCSTTSAAPYTFVAPCSDADSVIEEGPLPGDSQLAGRSPGHDSAGRCSRRLACRRRRSGRLRTTRPRRRTTPGSTRPTRPGMRRNCSSAAS